MESNKPERAVVLSRIYDAPRKLVFRVWTEPEHLQQWWGPHGFTNPVCEMNAQPGGQLRIIMRGPDGSEHTMTGIFQEVVAPTRLVFTQQVENPEGGSHLQGITTVTFAEEDGRTTVTVEATAVGLTPMSQFMLQGMEPGWSQSLARLATYLSEVQNS